MKLSYINLLIILFCTQSHAGNKVGNGGDGVFCKRQSKTEGKLLDFYEADFSPVDPEKNPYEIAKKNLSKLEGIAPQLASLYLKRLKELPNEVDDKADIDLEDLKDSKHFFKPKDKDCKVQQLAVRKTKVDKNEKRFLIDKELWKTLPSVHQAGLLTHEIIYEHFSLLGEMDSIKARKLNRHLYSKNQLDAKSFWIFIKELEVPIYPQ